MFGEGLIFSFKKKPTSKECDQISYTANAATGKEKEKEKAKAQCLFNNLT